MWRRISGWPALAGVRAPLPHNLVRHTRTDPNRHRAQAQQDHRYPCGKPWFEKQLSMVSCGSTLAEDIRYALNHWQGLTRFLENGRLELDTKPVENAIRPVCLTKKMRSSPGMRLELKFAPCLRRSSPPASSTTSTRLLKLPKHSSPLSMAIPIAADSDEVAPGVPM
ncbi:IS66 family transposase [Bradyrhizobium sp. BRP56]|uniref:IS66 family transposase n=1 Tax=Bradyrhizobium sp. BRP56 TaxID=2793819 RepID=UPI001CD3F2CA|nr:IS66 family transposase [Bradyrhizobium sp. BRP56]